jgi:hypothetical protein
MAKFWQAMPRKHQERVEQSWRAIWMKGKLQAQSF